MTEDKNKDYGKKNLEEDQTTPIQKKIEDKVAQDEDKLQGDELSVQLSEDRTHMSEHRTRMSEHRTDLSEHRTDLSEHRTDLSEERTDLSLERTMLSYERTLMSWIRTSISMISFGFTIYKFFEEASKGSIESPRLLTPRIVGIIMISFGMIALLMAMIQHQRAITKLKKLYPEVEKSLSSVLAFLILVFGLILFFGAVFRQ